MNKNNNRIEPCIAVLFVDGVWEIQNNNEHIWEGQAVA
jgi:hypothetical protein